MDYTHYTREGLLKMISEKTEEIIDLEEALKESDGEARSAESDAEHCKEALREEESKVEDLEEKVEELQETVYATVMGEQKQQIIEKLKRLDLESLEQIDAIYCGHVLGFEEILD